MNINDLMNMSDEEISGIADFGDSPKVEEAPEVQTETIVEADDNLEDDNAETEVTTEEGAEQTAEDTALSSGSSESTEATDTDQSGGDTAENTDTASDVVDYEALYKEVMKPFKANGREIKLDKPDEAVKLMQMGANYTKKMQAIQPNLKVLRMLENHELLDESKLSHLIDISKGDKAALARFMKDHSIDPMDIDADTAVDYQQGNHTVSDTEIEFQMVLDEVVTSESGQNLITHVQDQWDQTSKEAIFKNPELLRLMAQHASDGVYDQIANAVHRQKVLGVPQIANVPFLVAYEKVGKELASSGKIVPPSAGVQKPAALARTTAPKRAAVANSEQAKAASPSAKNSGKAKVVFNPLSGSDEEFLKAYEGKV